MNIDATDTVSVVADQRTALRRMTTGQLRHLGADQVVCVKCGRRGGERVLVIYSADGMPLSAMDTADTAVEVAANQGLQFVTVH
jgi:hypothetical protein